MCRSELAREKPEDAAYFKHTSVIVDVLREQARSYNGGGHYLLVDGLINARLQGLAFTVPTRAQRAQVEGLILARGVVVFLGQFVLGTQGQVDR